jgi:ribosomal protein S18 acetylase RimI-like enzyme
MDAGRLGGDVRSGNQSYEEALDPVKALSKHSVLSDRILIRRARPADAGIITRFNTAMGKETEGVALDKKRVYVGVRSILRDRHKGFYLLAEVGGKVVGQMMITREWSDWRNSHFWWIQSVYVLPTYRRRGVYRALHQYAIGSSKKRKDVCGIRLYVDWHNKRAQMVYKKLGMKRSTYDMFEEDFVLRRPE